MMRVSTCLHANMKSKEPEYNVKFSTDAKHFRKHGILYKTSVLSQENFDKIKRELSTMSLNIVKETTNSVAHGRKGAHIPSSSVIASIVSDRQGEISSLINDITESDLSWNISPIVPIELRIYDEKGAGKRMKLHLRSSSQFFKAAHVKF
jgi:hypothetical protein